MSGEYRPIRALILEDDDFMELSPSVRWVFVSLRLMLGKSGIGRLSKRTAAARAGVDGDSFERAVSALCDIGWLQVDDNVYWIVGGLKHEPYASMKWNQVSHVKSLTNHLESLPSNSLVDSFIEYYEPLIECDFSIRESIRPSSSRSNSVSGSVSGSVSKTKKEVKDFSHLTEWFEDQFWPLYRDGVKASGRSAVGKGKALTAMKKLNPDEELQAVIISHLTERAAIDQQVIQSGNEPTFWKDAERWIKAEGWTDELLKPKLTGADNVDSICAELGIEDEAQDAEWSEVQ